MGTGQGVEDRGVEARPQKILAYDEIVVAVVAPRPAEMPGLVAVVQQRVVRDDRPLVLVVERVRAPRLEAVEGEVVAY